MGHPFFGVESRMGVVNIFWEEGWNGRPSIKLGWYTSLLYAIINKLVSRTHEYILFYRLHTTTWRHSTGTGSTETAATSTCLIHTSV